MNTCSQTRTHTTHPWTTGTHSNTATKTQACTLTTVWEAHTPRHNYLTWTNSKITLYEPKLHVFFLSLPLKSVTLTFYFKVMCIFFKKKIFRHSATSLHSFLRLRYWCCCSICSSSSLHSSTSRGSSSATTSSQSLLLGRLGVKSLLSITEG